MALLLEAEKLGLMNGEYVFFLLQHFEVSGSVVSKTAEAISCSVVCASCIPILKVAKSFNYHGFMKLTLTIQLS